MNPERGLFEILVTEAVRASLEKLGRDQVAVEHRLRSADAADRIALHLARIVERALAAAPDRERVEQGIALTRHLLDVMEAHLARDLAADKPVEPGAVLRAIASRLPDGSAETIDEPLIPLLDTTLLTNAPGEPRVGHQLGTEVASADRIDVVMAFVRRSGIAPLLPALARHGQAGRSLRVLTTTYTGTTEARALEALRDAGADIRVSYDQSTTRLHAKAWLFARRSGFSTAYVGSSNLTHSAQVTGLEWNVRVSGARNPDVVAKVEAVFESYWNSHEFVPFDPDEFRDRTSERRKPDITLSPIELRPEPFQEHLLEQIEIARQAGHHRNLLVAATGTGKTVMAAVDYARLRPGLPRDRLLFVAHRQELLTQSLATFRHALRDGDFGELWVGGERPRDFDHVFASIQSLHATGTEYLDPAHFDVVIVDEFHHAAADSYRRLLEHVQPRELLGLTATPERSDGLPILDWFGGRIAAELRLWDAIDQHRLSPFLYYGVHDGLDLREVPWRRGRGYDIEGLTKLYTGNDVWARKVVAEVLRRVDDPEQMRALGFCVSIAHARFMARVFQDAGIPATAIWSDTPQAERTAALRDLANRKVNVVFSVDLFNEGIDVPDVDTLLMLRPTDSATLFLQQLGRGLRRSHGKTVCTVLDFVGHHRKEFRFDRRLRALVGGSRRELERAVEEGFPFLPAGCHMELDRVASEIVLESIRAAVPARWAAKVAELRQLCAGGEPPSLARYLTETGLELSDLYTGTRSWSDLCADADLPVAAPGPAEEALRRACGRLLHIEDRLRIDIYRTFLAAPAPPRPGDLGEPERRLLRMLVASVCAQALRKDMSLADGAELLWQHPQVRAELLELLDVLAETPTHVFKELPGHPDIPLRIHARYARIEILAACGLGRGARVAAWQTGVRFAPDIPADLLAFWDSPDFVDTSRSKISY